MNAPTANGWVKLHRSLLKHPRINDPHWLAVLVYLLLKATHQNYPVKFDGRIVRLQPGQLVTGRSAIAAATGVHEAKVKRLLALMKADQQIDQQAGVKGSIITVRNWHAYQDIGQQIGQQVDNRRPPADKSEVKKAQQNGQQPHSVTPCPARASGAEHRANGQQNGQQVDSSPAVNEDKTTTNKKTRTQKQHDRKNGMNITIPLVLDVPAFRETWNKWQQHRREIRKPTTPTTAAAQLAKLADWGVERAIAALQHSIANGWQGIFEPKGEPHASNHRHRAEATHGKYANVGTTIA